MSVVTFPFPCDLRQLKYEALLRVSRHHTWLLKRDLDDSWVMMAANHCHLPPATTSPNVHGIALRGGAERTPTSFDLTDGRWQSAEQRTTITTTNYESFTNFHPVTFNLQKYSSMPQQDKTDNSVKTRVLTQWNEVKNSVLDGVDQLFYQQAQQKQDVYLYLERETSNYKRQK
jgi:hypothetical protein